MQLTVNVSEDDLGTKLQVHYTLVENLDAVLLRQDVINVLESGNLVNIVFRNEKQTAKGMNLYIQSRIGSMLIPGRNKLMDDIYHSLLAASISMEHINRIDVVIDPREEPEYNPHE